MRNIYSGPTGLDTPITPKLCQVKPWNWVHILAAAALLLASFWITDPQLGHAQNSVPVKPAGLTAAAGNNQAALTWTDPSDNSITGYEYLQAQVDKLTASDGAARDDFGFSVAVDGDTVVVGASGYGDNGASSGSAYVYVRQSAAWSQVAKLTASDGVARDDFGLSVAVDGDTVVVGAIGDDDNGSNSGSAYVFTKPAAGWTTTSTAAKLTASDGAAGDYFGVSVAVYGDTVVVGAGWDDDKGEDSGSAYVFTKPGAGWTTTSSFAAKLTASDGAAGDKFGRSVAVNGNTVVVGARGDSDNGWDAGSAYVFTKPVADWTTTSNFAAKLTASDGEAHDYFGNSVAVDGDTVAVGATYDDDNGSKSGSAYVFTKPAAGWTTTSTAAKLTASDGAASDYFGQSVAVDGDTVAVGATYDDDNGSKSGSAYVFTKPAAGWTTTSTAAKLTASDGAAIDYFGQSVAVDGDTVLVGAPGYGDEGTNSGSAYIYELSDWTAVPNSAAAETNAISYTVTSLANDVEYRFQIRATNDVGTGPASNPATVTPTNTAPTAVNDTSSTAEDTAIDIAVLSNDTDAEGDTLSVTQVTSPPNGTAVILQGNTTSVTYTPNDDFNGTDSFDYTVSDGTDTDTGTVNVTITAVNDPPVAVEDNVTTPEDAAIDINVVSNDTDVEADALSVTQVTTPSNGVATIMAGSTTTVTYTPNANFNGTDSFDYTVSDGTDTDTGTVNVTITAVNDPPVAVEDNVTTPEDAAIDINVVSNDTDVEADALSVTQVTTPSNGVATIMAGSTTTVTYTPNANFNGTDSFDYTVSDGTDTDTGTVNVTITAVNDPPVAVEDNVTTPEDAAIDINVVSNDTDVDGDTLSVTAVTTPSYGTAAITAYSTTSVTYTPNANYNGTDSFTYTVSDGTGTDTGTVHVTITPKNQPPVAVDDTFSTSKNTAIDINVTSNDTDYDLDTLSVTGVTTPGNGTAAIVSGSTTTVTYTPNANFIGTDSFTYTLSDGTDTGTGTVTGTVGPPAQPAGFRASGQYTEARLTWDDPSDSNITGYDYLQEKVARLTASDGEMYDHFGYSIDVDGDTVVVGAQTGYASGWSGSVYVFTKPASGDWADATEMATLSVSEGAREDNFGRSVAVDGDTIVVGTPNRDNKAGAAYVFTRQSGAWSQVAKLTASDGVREDYFGASVAVDEDTVVVRAYGSVYLFTKPASGDWADATETAKLTSLGGGIAVDGDTIVVGADSVLVFTKPATGWANASVTARLTASDGAANDDFGYSVAVEGDTVVVGAPWGDDIYGSGPGSVYLFTKPATGWATATETAKLAASDGADYDRFGHSVAVNGDTVLVGIDHGKRVSPEDGDDSSPYLFTKPDSGWVNATETAKLTHFGVGARSYWGKSVAVDGDTITVGLYIHHITVQVDRDRDDQVGLVYVYDVSDWTAIPNSGAGGANTTSYAVTGLTNGEEYHFRIRAVNSFAKTTSEPLAVTVGPPASPTGLAATGGDGQADLQWDNLSVSSISGYEYLHGQVAKLTASDGAAYDRFGGSVAVDGDTVVVGAPEAHNWKGAAHVFVWESGAWSQIANLTASDGGEDGHFGNSVAIDGDTIVVGASWHDNYGSQSGMVYVFTKPASGGWATANETAKLAPSDGDTYDRFGDSVAVEGDTVVVGAPWGDDIYGSGPGSVYLFTKPATGWATATETAKLTASDGTTYFGGSVALDGDTIVVGERGGTYLFIKPPTGWADATETARLTASDRTSGDDFGYSVAVDGDIIVIGARYDDDNGFHSGSVYLFTKPASGWVTDTQTAKLTPSDGAASERFGYSVAVDGDTVVVGAPWDDDNGLYSGSAYLFTKPSSGGWATATETVKLTPSDGTGADVSYGSGGAWFQSYGDRFGNSVAVDGDTVVVGAIGDHDNGPYTGSAYVYEAVSAWTAVPDSADGGANATSYAVAGLTNDAEHDFRIRAINSYTEGAVSGIATATPTNYPPTAADDTVSTPEDTAVDIDVVTNDTDPDSGTTLLVTAVTTPSNGAAAITSGSTTTVTYTPNANYNGTDSFDYTLSDGTDTDTGTVNLTITAVNDPPVAVNDFASTPEETVVDINVVSNDIDVEDDALSVTQVTTPSNGTAVILQGSTTTLTYTPKANFAGADNFTYIVSDGTDNSTGTVSVTVTRVDTGRSNATPVNRAPIAVEDNVTTEEDLAVDIDVVSNDTDANGDTLYVIALTTPINGAAAMVADSTATVTYTPDTDFAGTDSFTYTVSDGAYTDTGTVNVTVKAAEVNIRDLVNLSALTVTSGTGNDPLVLNEEFAEDTTEYTLNVPNSVDSVRVTPTKKYHTAANVVVKIKVKATEVDSKTPIEIVPGGITTIEIDVIATISPSKEALAQITQTYTVQVFRAPGVPPPNIGEGSVEQDPTLSFAEGSQTTRWVTENTPSGRTIGEPISATDVTGNQISYVLLGTDATLFKIDSTSGQLLTNGPLNFETKPGYWVSVAVSNSGGSR